MATSNNSRAASTGTATSRAGLVRPAVRRATRARLALSGPSGSGKTWTALSIAEVLSPGGKTVVIDTEPGDNNQGAAELYADAFDFHHVKWDPPYDPRDLALTLSELGSIYDVCIVDSGSHFWRGSGGTLDVADGRFGGWKVATPIQDALLDTILRSPAHMIFCTRAKQAYEVSEAVKDGRVQQSVVKLGLAPIQRDDLEYEFQVVVMMDVEHRMDVGKTRCADLAGKSFHANDQKKFAEIYEEWLKGGVPLIRQADADTIAETLDTVSDVNRRRELKTEFKRAFGIPSTIAEDKLPAAWAWLSGHMDVDPHKPFEDPNEPSRCANCYAPIPAGWHDEDAPTLSTGPQGSEDPTSDDPPTDPETGEDGQQEPLSADSEAKDAAG